MHDDDGGGSVHAGAVGDTTEASKNQNELLGTFGPLSQHRASVEGVQRLAAANLTTR